MERLLDSLIVVDNDGVPDVAVQKGGLHAVEALVLARYYMFSQVYYHRTRRLFDHYLTSFLKETLPSFKENNLLEVLKWDDETVFSLIREAISSSNDRAREYATYLWLRGGGAGTKKHSMVYETNEFPGLEWVKAIRTTITGLSGRLSGYDILDDYPTGVIHKFYREGDQEEGDLFKVYIGRQQKLSLLTKESKIIHDMPRKFLIVRVYVKAPVSQINTIKKRLNSIKEE